MEANNASNASTEINAEYIVDETLGEIRVRDYYTLVCHIDDLRDIGEYDPSAREYATRLVDTLDDGSRILVGESEVTGHMYLVVDGPGALQADYRL